MWMDEEKRRKGGREREGDMGEGRGTEGGRKGVKDRDWYN